MQLKTWVNGGVDEDDLNEGVRDELDFLMDPPNCTRVGSTSGVSDAGAWALVPLALPGTGSGDTLSWANRAGFGTHGTRITAPEDGLYEVSWACSVRSTASSGTITFAQAAVAINATSAEQVYTRPISRAALGPIVARWQCGEGSATVPLAAGQWVSMAARGDGIPWISGPDFDGNGLTRLSLRWVGELP
jgi:hypothetical protein